MLKSLFKKTVPWLITAFALWWVFKEVEWDKLFEYMKNAKPMYILGAVLLTCSSYILRSFRWQILFPNNPPKFFDSYKVLILGFFMNNVLPARTGEFVRAHLGAKVTGASRALVLGTIASERLIDGLMISLYFVVFSASLGELKYSRELFLVALLFFGSGVTVITILACKEKIVELVQKFHSKKEIKSLRYLTKKAGSFIDGLDPLYSAGRFIKISAWSFVIWSIELLVFYLVAGAYDSSLSVAHTVLFMVAVNFSSLVPSAPGGIGVIEAAATAILGSIGLEHERGLAMVLTQHIIQYVVVGIPGAIALATWKGKVIEEENQDLT